MDRLEKFYKLARLVDENKASFEELENLLNCDEIEIDVDESLEIEGVSYDFEN